MVTGEKRMADSVQERVGVLEQRSHTHDHRIGQLEAWPERVTNLEKTVENLNINMINLQRSQQEMRDETRHGLETLCHDVKHGFRELRGATSAQQGERAGFSRALKWISGLMILGAMGASAAMWYADNVSPSRSAQCNDGSYSTSTGSGTCSGNGGVRHWIKR